MICVQELTKSFGAFRALDHISLTVPEGSVYGLVGPNGAGKSTLIRHITGVYRPDSGSVSVNDQSVFDNPAAKSKIICTPPPEISCGSIGAFTPTLIWSATVSSGMPSRR